MLGSRAGVLKGNRTACFGAAATAGPRCMLNGARRTLQRGAADAAAQRGRWITAKLPGGSGRCAPAVSDTHPPHSLVKRLADLRRARHRHLLMW